MKRNCARNFIPLFLIHTILLFNFVIAKNEYLKVLERCAAEKSTFNCLKQRALEILDTAIHDDTVYVLNDYISIAKDPAVSARSSDGSVKNENGTALTLDEKLDNKFHEYLSSRSIKFTIPGNALEARKKKDKGYGGIMIAAMAMGGMLAQLAYGKIAFIAGTALITAKIALVLSAIIGLKKLVSGGQGGGHEVIYATAAEHHGGGGGGGGGYGSGYGGWQRSFTGIPPT